MTKKGYHFIIALGLIGSLSAIMLFLATNEFGTSALLFFNGISLAGVGFFNLKKQNEDV